MFSSSFAVLAVGLIVFFLVIATYNTLVAKRQEVQESWSAIETELRRRFDLIPNLVETVKGYAGHEHDTLQDVIKARNAAVVQGPLDAQIASQNTLTAALGKLMALSESYPQLKANENFMQLQGELNETETRISQARRFYNANVKEYNTAVQSFPAAIIASLLGFKMQPYYAIDNPDAYDPVKVSFSKPAAGATDGATIKVPDAQKEKS